MESVNYYHVIKKVKCTECKNISNDVDWSHTWETTYQDKNNISMDIFYICPSCGTKNTMEILND
jgi:hypothetical protein